ncbi:MAG: KH domain-containing protein [Pirellulales bacterium]
METRDVEATLTLSDPDVVLQLFGPQDQNIRLIRSQLGVTVTHRSGQVRISGPSDAVRLATEVLERLKEKVYRVGAFPDEAAESIHKLTGREIKPPDTKEVAVGNPGRRVKPRTEGQARYVETIRTRHDVLK